MDGMGIGRNLLPLGAGTWILEADKTETCSQVLRLGDLG